MTSIESLFDSNKDTGEMTSVVVQGLVKSYPLLTNKKNRADLHRQALNPKSQKHSNVFAYTNIGKIIDVCKLKSNNLVSF